MRKLWALLVVVVTLAALAGTAAAAPRGHVFRPQGPVFVGAGW